MATSHGTTIQRHLCAELRRRYRLNVTTGAGTDVTGGTYGIRALNYGTGALTVTANGDVTGTDHAGILAHEL